MEWIDRKSFRLKLKRLYNKFIRGKAFKSFKPFSKIIATYLFTDFTQAVWDNVDADRHILPARPKRSVVREDCRESLVR